MIKKRNTTGIILSHMLKENTGIALCDSGGAYGRNWEKNQDRSFKSEPASVLSIDFKYEMVGYSLNTYHYLFAHLNYDDEARKLMGRFRRFEKRPEFKNCGWLEIMRRFYDDVLTPEIKKQGKGRYDSGGEVINTANYESSVDQALQFLTFPWGDQDYVMLQIHGGCDLRGGYTAPVIFAVDGEGVMDLIFDDGDFSITFEGGHDGDYWTTDDHGSHWYGAYGGKEYTSIPKEEIFRRLREALKPTDEEIEASAGREISIPGTLYGVTIPVKGG